MSGITWTDVDGVPTVWTEASGPMRAGLLFRAGRSDETYATGGRIHLLEHMALRHVDDGSDRRQGFVSGPVTGFMMVGSPDEVAEALRDVCAALTHLPADRLESERSIIAAESAARPYSMIGTMLAWRFGAGGPGLTSMPEHGLRNATIEQLRALAAERFTSGNAVLWLSGRPPAGLRLPLPTGARRALSPLETVLPEFPCWYVDDRCGGIGCSATVPRTWGASIFCEVASRRLRAHLRESSAVSYGPTAFYEPVGPSTAHVTLYADSDMERRRELSDAFGEVWEGLAEVSDEEVDAAASELVERWAGSLAPPPDEAAVQDVQQAAMETVTGGEYLPRAAHAAGLRAVTAADVMKVVEAVRSTALFAVPGEAVVRAWMGTRAPSTTAAAVDGKVVYSADAPIQRERLVYGPEGVMVRWPDGSFAAVRYAQLAGALTFDDGGVCLVGRDAGSVTVEPTLWRRGDKVGEDIRALVPPDVVIPMGPRPDDAIPKPTTTRRQRFRATVDEAFSGPPGTGGSTGVGGIGPASAVLIALAIWLMMEQAGSSTPGDPLEGLGPVLVLLVGVPLILLAAYVQKRRRTSKARETGGEKKP